MASGRQDALLWLGLGRFTYLPYRCLIHTHVFSLGLFGFCAARTVHLELLAIRKASQITKEEKPPELISQHTENGQPTNLELDRIADEEQP